MPKVEVKNAEPDGSVANGLLAEFDKLTQRVRRRAYELFEKRGRNDGANLDDWFRAEQELLFPVKFETKEEPGRYILRSSVPGFAGKDLKVYTLGDSLIVKGESAASSDAQGLSSEESRSFFYQWPLPTGAHANDVTAEFKQEELTINIPVDAKPKLVPVQASDSGQKQLQAAVA